MVAWNKNISSNKILAKNKRRKAKTVLHFFTLIIATSVINTRSIIGIVVLTTIIKSSLYIYEEKQTKPVNRSERQKAE